MNQLATQDQIEMQGQLAVQDSEQSSGAMMAAAKAEIEGAIVVAQRFPRNEDASYQKIMKACGRPSFAIQCQYSYPRGGGQVKGPSINLAREMARCWGNIRTGADVIRDTKDERTIRCWAWDLESNTKEQQDVSFSKLVQRKRDGRTQWVEPDERDLRELSNKQAAVGVRNCILHLMPRDFVDEAMAKANQSMTADISKDIDANRRKLIEAFSKIGVKVEMIEEYIGHELSTCSPEEIASLRTIWKSIFDGNSTWAEQTGQVKENVVKGGAAAKSNIPVDEKPKETPPKKKSTRKSPAKESSTKSAKKGPVALEGLDKDLAGCQTPEDVSAVLKDRNPLCRDEEEFGELATKCEQRETELKQESSEGTQAKDGQLFERGHEQEF